MGNVDCVAGREFYAARLRHRSSSAREAIEVRRLRIDQTGWSSRRRELEWADVQVRNLVGREQSEPPSPGDDHGEVAKHIVVRCGYDPIADPNARFDCRVDEGQSVLLDEAGKHVAN